LVHYKSFVPGSENGKAIVGRMGNLKEVGGAELEASTPPLWPLQLHPNLVSAQDIQVIIVEVSKLKQCSGLHNSRWPDINRSSVLLLR
jgi:hypothetical protein